MAAVKLPPGILLVDKPVGITSFDVIRRLRRTLQVKKMGHAGTLDPLASGLMIIGVGPATKLLHTYLKLPKTYEAEICIGESTTTADREGDVIERRKVTGVREEMIQMTISEMVGTLQLPVPAYSAIKQGGEALYKKARRGEKVEVPIKPMEVRAAQCVAMREDDGLLYSTVLFEVGNGTYVRSLAEELGRRLGFPARLSNLRRTQVGEFRIEEAMTLQY